MHEDGHDDDYDGELDECEAGCVEVLALFHGADSSMMKGQYGGLGMKKISVKIRYLCELCCVRIFRLIVLEVCYDSSCSSSEF